MTDTINADPLPDDELELRIKGGKYTGWTSVEVTRAIDAVSGAFRVTSVPQVRTRWPVRPGDKVQVRIADEILVDGFVDDLVATSDASTRSISASGRDRTADLVDCSALNQPGQWLQSDLRRLLEDLAGPFGISVDYLLEDAGPVFEKFQLQAGESAWAAIDRLCRLRAALAYSDGQGRLQVGRPGTERALVDILQDGSDSQNVLSSKVSHSHRERFSSIVVRGQRKGDDNSFGLQSTSIKGSATDKQISRYRPLIVMAEGAVSEQEAIARAEWEAITRAGRGTSIEVTVQGWRQGPGLPVWGINRLARVKLDDWGVDGEMVIRAVRFSRTLEEGSSTTLSLVRPDVYAPKPVIEAKEDPVDRFLEFE